MFASDPPAAALMTVATAPEDTLPDAPAAPLLVTEKGLPLAILNILKDQVPIWTSPVRIRPHDLMGDVSRDPASTC